MYASSVIRAVALLCVTSSTATAIPTTSGHSASCRCFPGDVCWPSATEWMAFNQTLGGKLVVNSPLASVCHDSAFGPYNAEKCDALRSVWFDPETHLGSISSIMAPLFTNNSCNLFTAPNTPCTLGNLVSFAVNATGPEDFQRTIAFAKVHNIRLVIRNTGHDYNGKSTGAGALAIWTHFMKDQELVSYTSPSYNGPAVKMGAGVEVIESYEFAHAHGLVSVGGDCPTVGVVGGWTQGGGGHGPGVSKFGNGADQALEWEVITAAGEVLIANREQNPDLYWALTGGGGGTYGVVSSLIAKVYPDLMSTSATLSFSLRNNTEGFWDTVSTWQSKILSFTSSGCFAIWSVSSTGFSLEPANCPGLSEIQMRKLFQPTLAELKQHQIPYNLTIQQFPNFLQSYTEYNVKLPKDVSKTQLGSRLVPKSVLKHNNAGLIKVFREVVSRNASVVVQAVDVAKPHNETDYTSLNPVRRKAAFNAILSTPYDQTNYDHDLALANEMTFELLPMLEAITPNASAYLNECDFQQPNWQEVLYGVNYGRLMDIKNKYDPEHMFYALQAVGSEDWYEDQARGGRLCRVAA